MEDKKYVTWREVPQARHWGRRWCCSHQAGDTCRVSVLQCWGRISFQGTSVFALKAFNWWDEAHTLWGAIYYLKSIDLKVSNIKKKYLHRNIQKNDQITWHSSLAQLTNKPNHQNEYLFKYLDFILINWYILILINILLSNQVYLL